MSFSIVFVGTWLISVLYIHLYREIYIFTDICRTIPRTSVRTTTETSTPGANVPSAMLSQVWTDQI